MLTRITVRNFKAFSEAKIELGNPVVFVGPNDSGKTSALQALTLWDLGWRRWTEKRGDQSPPHRPGVAINRRDLVGVPVPSARQLWRELRVRETYRVEGMQRTENIRIDVVVDGVTGTHEWSCGLEFDFANQESFYCRPLRTGPGGEERMELPPTKLLPRIALLGPMSGLASNETRLVPGAINVRVGEGRTAEVLRNLCLQVTELPDGEERWDDLSDRMAALFGVRLDRPRLVPARGEVELTYVNRSGSRLDLTASGRGMQQTLLLLSFISLHPDSVVLLDEPDAHLEILRQRQTYRFLSDIATSNGTQVICASHSEVMLNEAAERGSVVAFVGTPHRIDDRYEVLKALRDIDFEDYYQADLVGFVLYVEGSTDLELLQAFAHALRHDVARVLERPFVRYVGDRPDEARRHFYGLREAKSDLVGYALFDHVQKELNPPGALVEHMWPRREIENYLVPTKAKPEYARLEGEKAAKGPLLEYIAIEQWQEAMDKAIRDRVPPAALRDPSDAYWANTKISDVLLTPVFDAFFRALELPNRMPKANYHRLVALLKPEDIHEDVVSVLDSILDQSGKARPHA